VCRITASRRGLPSPVPSPRALLAHLRLRESPQVQTGDGVECESRHVVTRRAAAGDQETWFLSSLLLGLNVTFSSFICDMKGLN